MFWRKIAASPPFHTEVILKHLDSEEHDVELIKEDMPLAGPTLNNDQSTPVFLTKFWRKFFFVFLQSRSWHGL